MPRFRLPGDPGSSLFEGMEAGTKYMSNLLQNQQAKEMMPYQTAMAAQNLADKQYNLNLMQRMMGGMYSPLAQDAEQGAQSLMPGQQSPMSQFQPSQQQNPLGAYQQQLPQQDELVPDSEVMGQPSNIQEMVKNNPLLAQMIKQRTGIDPYAESPEQKEQRKLETFKQQEDYKRNQPKDILSSGAQTEAQKQLIDIDTIMPMVEELKEAAPEGWGVGFGEPARKFRTKLTDTVDRYINAVKAPKDKETRKDIKAMFNKSMWESQSEYRERIDNILNTLQTTQESLGETTTSGKVGRPKKRYRYNPETGAYE